MAKKTSAPAADNAPQPASDSKTFRATQDGFVNGHLILAGATFVAFADFDPAWAVEVEDHRATVDNPTAQEALDGALAPVVPKVEVADAPLPIFHPTVEVVTADALAATNAGDKTPVEFSSALNSTSDPAKAAPAPNSAAAKKAAKEASAAEAEAQDAKDDGGDLT